VAGGGREHHLACCRSNGHGIIAICSLEYQKNMLDDLVDKTRFKEEERAEVSIIIREEETDTNTNNRRPAKE
jgi:hypothetical protein